MKPHYTNTRNPVDFPKPEHKMNERIEKLALHAAEYAIELTVKYPELYFPTFTEKFAELIVRECAETIQDFVVHRFPASEYPGRLKNYFGVK